MPEYQSSSTVFASGPTTAIDFSLPRSSGSRPAEFRSSTIDLRVTSRTSARVSGWLHGSGSFGAPIAEYGKRSGGSSEPRRIETRKSPRRA